MPRALRLTKTAPSPSTTCYTVTDAAPRDTLLAQILYNLTIMLRIISAVGCFGILAALNGIVQLPDLGNGQVVGNITSAWTLIMSDWRKHWCAVLACWTVLWMLGRRGYTEESLLLLRSLGIQTISSSSSFLGTPTTRFIPTSQIQDIFIHEAFVGFEVKFYLAVIVEGEEEAVVVFPKLLPKRGMLEEVWRAAKLVLYSRENIG